MTADAPCRLGVAAVVLLVIACGDGSRDVADASLDGSTDLGPDVATTRPSVAAPMPPAPTEPTSFDCPTGWQPFETEHGAQACHSWPGGEPPECAAHEMPLPGEGCVPIGSPCASDGWAADLPAEGVLYVRSGAPAGGDGTRDRPFDRIGAA
ncbi:MAG: hypothetical protein IT379_36250, partial [Deltaproteobacteria bacterium]|nr:hypothetical protein [Deltaproteobacteria bacterium]